MAASLHINQIDTITLVAFDANGAPVPGTVFDSIAWANSSESVAVSAVNGTSFVLTPVASAVGQSTTVSVVAVLTQNGSPQTFTFSEDVTLTGAIGGTGGPVASVGFNHSFSPAP